MTPLTLESFEMFLADTNNASLVAEGKYGVLLIESEESVKAIEITADDFEKYAHGLKDDDHELNDGHATWPWVQVV